MSKENRAKRAAAKRAAAMLVVNRDVPGACAPLFTGEGIVAKDIRAHFPPAAPKKQGLKRK